MGVAVPAYETPLFGDSSPSSWPGDLLDIPLSIEQTLQFTDPSLEMPDFAAGSTSGIAQWWEDSTSFCQNKQML